MTLLETANFTSSFRLHDLGRLDKGMGIVDRNNFLSTPRHLKGRTAHRASEVEGALDSARRKPLYDPVGKPKRLPGPSRPRADLFRASVVKQKILIP